MNPTNFRSLLRSTLLEGGVLFLGAVLVPLVVISDREVFMHGLSEHSVTEFLQAILVLLSASVFWMRSAQLPEYRSWLQCMGGFFTIVLIREMDFYLDYVYHGFWSLVASLFLVFVVVLALRSRGTFKNGLAHFISSNSTPYFMSGVIIVIVFSRIFGSGDFLQSIMQDQYSAAIKTYIQEGLELLGYFLVTVGAVKFALMTRSKK
ncbi:MAG: hypothetical protein HKN15_10835 [Xanthomonadales bacterium]|nr:hypothetical protein [Xanthomonadales bacterium]